MAGQSDQDQLHEFDQYINGTYNKDVDTSNILNLFQDPQPNSDQFSYNPLRNYGNSDQGYHPYESPSSTTNSMDQTFHQDSRNSQHYKLNKGGHYQPMNCEQEFNNQTNRILTIPTSTQSFVQTIPTTEQTFTQNFLEIKEWDKIELPGNVKGDLVKTKNQNLFPTTDNYTLLDLSSSNKPHQQPQWQEEEPLTPNKEQHKPTAEKCHSPIPILIDNQQPFKINEEIITQIQNQATKQGGVKQIIKIRNPDLIPTAQSRNPDIIPATKQTAMASARASPIPSTSSPLRLKSDHKPEIIKQVIRSSSKPRKGRPPKRPDTSDKFDNTSSRLKRSSRNIVTSKYAKLRLILEKLEDQEYAPHSPTTSQKKENRTLADFQVEVVALMKNEMSHIITRYAINKKVSERTK